MTELEFTNKSVVGLVAMELRRQVVAEVMPWGLLPALAAQELRLLAAVAATLPNMERRLATEFREVVQKSLSRLLFSVMELWKWSRMDSKCPKSMLHQPNKCKK